jgi:hypothetical protein
MNIAAYLGKALARIMIFIGNLFPLFLVVFIIYFNSPYEFLTIIIMLASFILLFFWKYLLGASYKTGSRNTKTLEIKTSSDSSSSIIGYFLTYTVSIPSIAVVGGIKGLIILFILLIMIYLVLYENKIAFYNPFLFLFKYKMYHIETTEMALGYLITKVDGNEYRPNGRINAVQIDDFIYVARRTQLSSS